MFSPPVSREVTSADVKYAIERAFTAAVANGYVQTYFGDVIGAPDAPGHYKPVRGIRTPDPQTIVFKLDKDGGAALAGALAMPISIPVPKEYAQQYDKTAPSTYGEEHAVYTGPYKVESDAEGKLTGFVPGRSIEPRPQPGLQRRRRLPARVPRRDPVPVRQRRRRHRHPADPVRREHGGRRHRAAGEPAQDAAPDRQASSSPRCPAAAGARSRWTRAARPSTTWTCARR